MLPSQQSKTARRADPGRTVTVGKGHPLGSKAINVRRLDLCLIVAVGYIRHAHVIGV